MTGIVRTTRQQLGITMADLTERMRIGVQAVSTMELNDERGAIRVETRTRALNALGKREIVVVVDAVPDDMLAEAQTIAAETAWTMALSGKILSRTSVEDLVQMIVDDVVNRT